MFVPGCTVEIDYTKDGQVTDIVVKGPWRWLVRVPGRFGRGRGDA